MQIFPYKQTKGLTIGGPVSGVLADFVITDLLDTAIYEAGLDPTIAVKYVDDILMAISRDEIENFLQILNKQNNSIDFTMEVEEQNKIPYLDMLLHKNQNGTISTSLYQKPTSKNRMLNFNSAHPRSQLRGMAYGFISRAMSITSKEFSQKTINTIYEVLNQNGFHNKLIKQLLNKYHNFINSNQTTNQTNTTKIYKSLTYIPTLSENLQKLFQTYDSNLRIGFKPHITIRKSTDTNKTKINPAEKHNVVYKFDCNDCQGTYIGQTGRKLAHRIKQHKYDIKQKFKLKNKTAAIQHIINTGHSFNYDDTRILSSASNLNKRLTKESIYINHFKNTSINMRSDIDSLHPSYIPLLKHLK